MLPELVAKKIAKLTSLMERLLQQESVSYEKATPSSFPETKGVYVISSSRGEVIRAGKTGEKNATLRQRLYSNHLMGDQAGNLRAQLFASGQCSSLEQAKSWIRGNCSARFIQIEDKAERANAEHFMLAVLEPRFCDDNKSVKGFQDGGAR